MNPYIAKKAGITALSLLIALALVMITATSLLVGIFLNEKKLAAEIRLQADDIIAVVDEASAVAAQRFGYAPEVLKGAVSRDNIGIIANPVAFSLVKGYVTDFSDNTELFNAFMARINDYGTENNVSFSNKAVIELASYATDLAADRLYTAETARVPMIKYTKNNVTVYLLFGSVLALAAAVIAIAMMTRGRHRKFSYIGMGVITAGYVDIGLSLWANYKGYFRSLEMMSFSPYNEAMKQCFEDYLRYSIAVGAVLFAVGLVMLVLNYNYFRKKNAMIQAAREMDDDIKADYMDVETNTSTRLPGEEFEKEVMKIDFD